ncbi:MAG TPA: LD-carboxypeptidase, partial [Candidatus Polarisedimenticolaceae bacterium]|nr:LD-carboxypeptidase [Candidatus Polarisedimenticolaceae bacterium]
MIALARGDTVAVVASGFAVRPEPLAAGLTELRRMGYEPAPGRNLAAREGYLAGSDATRLADLLAAWRDPRVRAIWFARGGYGTARLLDAIPWKELRRRPKLLIGYSDLTALFPVAAERTGSRCIHGPLVAELGRPEAFHRASLRAALAG